MESGSLAQLVHAADQDYNWAVRNFIVLIIIVVLPNGNTLQEQYPLLFAITAVFVASVIYPLKSKQEQLELSGQLDDQVQLKILKVNQYQGCFFVNSCYHRLSV